MPGIGLDELIGIVLVVGIGLSIIVGMVYATVLVIRKLFGKR